MSTTRRIVEQQRKLCAKRLTKVRGLAIHDEDIDNEDATALSVKGPWGYPVSVDGDPTIAFCPKCFSHYSDFEKTAVVPCWNCRAYDQSTIPIDALGEYTTQEEHDWQRESGGAYAVSVTMQSEAASKHYSDLRDQKNALYKQCIEINQLNNLKCIKTQKRKLKNMPDSWYKTEQGIEAGRLLQNYLDKHQNCIDRLQALENDVIERDQLYRQQLEYYEQAREI